MERSTAIACSQTSLSVFVTTDGGVDALQKFSLAEESVESTTMADPESTVSTESAVVVGEEMVR